jgi:hypothetical protein
MAFNQAWLENPNAIRGILVEVMVSISGNSDIPIYLSNIGYITTDASIAFNPVLSNSISFSESISLDGSISMSFGDIEIENPNGELDIYLDSSYVWVNRPIKVYVGDPTWVCADLTSIRNTFGLVFNGVVSDLDSKSRSTLNIKVRDKLERLNTPITENTLGTYGTWVGGQTNQATILPLIFGEVHNIEPLLIDPALLEYQVSDGEVEKVIELRDNGAPLYTNNDSGVILNVGVPAGNLTGATVSDNIGKLTLMQKLYGTLTASVQGVKKSVNFSGAGSLVLSYNNNIAHIIAIICTQYGKVLDRLTFADIDLVNFNAFSSICTQSVGVHISDKTNMLDICQQLASSVGAQVYFNKLGLLQLIRLGNTSTNVTTTSSITTITDADILQHSLELVTKSEVVAAIKVGYCKNWTVQSGLTTGIPDSNKTLLSEEESFIIDNTTAASIATSYRLSKDPDVQETLLIDGTEANAEATRRLNYFKYPRLVFKLTGTSRLLGLVLGQQITLIHNRFNLYNGGVGKSGQVISLSPSWAKGTIEVEVII